MSRSKRGWVSRLVQAGWAKLRRYRTALTRVLLVFAIWFAVAVIIGLICIWIGVWVTPGAYPPGITVIPSLLIGVGTLSLAAAALFKDQILYVFLPLKTRIVPHKLTGILVLYDSAGRPLRERYYSLAVRNETKLRTAKNCIVMLVRVSRLGPAGKYIDEIPTCEFPFVWAPGGAMPSRRDIQPRKLAPFDFIYLTRSGELKLVLQYRTMNFDVSISPGTVRFWLEVEADGYWGTLPSVWEVAWDGECSLEDQQMGTHLSIKDVTADLERERKEAWQEGHNGWKTLTEI